MAGAARAGSSGSGGILIFPDAFYQQENLLVSADKESKLYFEQLSNLGGFNANGDQNVEIYLTPNIHSNQDGNPSGTYPQSAQGYWASPAYWKYVDGRQQIHYLLYYSATVQVTVQGGSNEVPYPIYQYDMGTSASTPPGPISDTINAAAKPTQDLFCWHSPTPSVSSSGTTAGTGVLWAVERRFSGNPKQSNCAGTDEGSALHAYDAAGMNELYNSSTNLNLVDAGVSVPTVFQGRVYVGAAGQVYVFGLCATGPDSACIQPQ